MAADHCRLAAGIIKTEPYPKINAVIIDIPAGSIEIKRTVLHSSIAKIDVVAAAIYINAGIL